jgi:hypothetical protein
MWLVWVVVLLCVVLLTLAGWYLYSAMFGGGSVREEESVVSSVFEEEEEIDSDVQDLEVFVVDEEGVEGDFEKKDQFLLRERVDVAASTLLPVEVVIPGGVSSVQFVISAEEFVGNSLIDPNHVVRETIRANSSVAREKYRTFFVDSPVTGPWVMEFSNKHPELAADCLLMVKANDYYFVVSVDVFVDDSGRVKTAVLVTRGDEVVIGGDVVVEIEDQNKEVVRYRLYDDGEHDDGEALDGVYAGLSSRLEPGGYFVVVRARDEEDEVLSIDSVYVD